VRKAPSWIDWFFPQTPTTPYFPANQCQSLTGGLSYPWLSDRLLRRCCWGWLPCTDRTLQTSPCGSDGPGEPDGCAALSRIPLCGYTRLCLWVLAGARHHAILAGRIGSGGAIVVSRGFALLMMAVDPLLTLPPGDPRCPPTSGDHRKTCRSASPHPANGMPYRSATVQLRRPAAVAALPPKTGHAAGFQRF
jgi:hypothetical protein